MTIIVQKRVSTDVLVLFLVGMLGLAAILGNIESLAVRAVLGTIALAILVGWVIERRKPARFLTISPDEIAFGRLEEPGVVITRESGNVLETRYVHKAGTFLGPAGLPKPAIHLHGFDVAKVRAACEAHGWAFAG